ncbi:MAG: multicopper oxidase domain-containing protein [Acetobacteraceae bacterium]
MPSWKDKLALTAQRNRQEIVKAKLDRREMMRLGLLTVAGSLIAKAGLSARAFADQGPGGGGGSGGSLIAVQGVDGPPSPPATPWVQPMPTLTVKTPIDPNTMQYGPPDGTTPINGATQRIPHQYFSYNAANNTFSDKFGTTNGSYNAPFNIAGSKTKFFQLQMKEVQLKLHPDYSPTTVWGFDGLVPGPLFRVKYGEPAMVRFYNQLPSVKVPQPFGIAEMTAHLHNGHTPSESDGNPVNFFNSINDPNAINPHGFKDQHYPNVKAGYTARGDLVGDPTEAMSSLWYHDHHLDFTAQNVYHGMFGCYNLFDDLDTGDETTGLRLPSGKYDVPIFFNDFVFDQNCQQVFDLFDLDGILGDRFCANGVIQPHFEVDKRRYRFRFYVPGPSRWNEFAFFDGTNYIPFWQISSDGNLLQQAIQVSSVRVAVAERVDIIIDFNKVSASRLYLVNRLEQVNGRGPTGNVLTPGTPIVQINIGAKAPDYSVDPAAKPLLMRTLPDPDFNALLARAAKATTRSWRFERGNGGWMVNGNFFDENVVSAAIPIASEEVWLIQNPGGSWRHPVHIHFEEHRVLSRNGVLVKPNAQNNASVDYARKDVIELNTSEEVKIFMRFRDMKGRYVMHCHNVVHEDHAMMIRWDIV